jgi:thioredoxin-like negative regulator of GroEL
MLERLIVLVGCAVLAALVVYAARTWARARSMAARAAAPEPFWQALETHPDGRASVVAFSTPSCAACHLAQAPALDALRRQLGETAVRVLKVNAADRPDVAKQFGVLTVPTTVVMAANGRVAAINHGFASTDRLAAQVLATA